MVTWAVSVEDVRLKEALGGSLFSLPACLLKNALFGPKIVCQFRKCTLCVVLIKNAVSLLRMTFFAEKITLLDHEMRFQAKTSEKFARLFDDF